MIQSGAGNNQTFVKVVHTLRFLLVAINFFAQWSFGVTCWEIFSTAKTPYPGIHPTSLIAQLENGERLPKPNNAACCDSMYAM